MTQNDIALADHVGEIMEQVIIKGDLSKLSPIERAQYYTQVCESIGLNPLTKPFEYMKLSGKDVLYARKDATDQLRKKYGVSVIEMTEVTRDGLMIVTVKVRDANGRTDMAKGVVSLKGLQGDNLANAIMKAETKAKRRATLSICGLGFLDETELETIAELKQPRVLKKDHRADYHAIQLELDEVISQRGLQDWRTANADRVGALPLDWQKQIDKLIEGKSQDMDLGLPVRNCGEILSDPGPQRPQEETVVWDDDVELTDADNAGDALGPRPWRREADTTAEAYTDWWDSVILSATPSKRADILKMWNDQKDFRDKIEWTDEHPFSALKRRVVDALELLKAST
jgi:hypothetical protein